MTSRFDLFVEVMIMVALADRSFEKEELENINQLLQVHKEFADVPKEQLTKAVEEALGHIEKFGFERRLFLLANQYPDYSDRLDAFAVGLDMAVADGVNHPDEVEVMNKIRTNFGIKDEDVFEILKKAHAEADDEDGDDGGDGESSD